MRASEHNESRAELLFDGEFGPNGRRVHGLSRQIPLMNLERAPIVSACSVENGATCCGAAAVSSKIATMMRMIATISILASPALAHAAEEVAAESLRQEMAIVAPALLADTMEMANVSAGRMSTDDDFCGEHPWVVPDSAEVPLTLYRKQAVQKITVSSGWLAPLSSNDLSSRFFEASIEFGVPLGSFDSILGVTPSFRADYIDAAATVDIPAELFETGVSFFYRRPLNDRWSAMAIVRPSVRSDFTTGDEAFRLFGLGLLNWRCRPDELTLSIGAVFLDRADLPLLPAIGLTWQPMRETKLDLRFPESKLSWRLAKDGKRSETWSYLSAGIGGNTWAITRASGQTDEVSLRDVRLMWGVDHVTDGGGGFFAECGFALMRRIEYESTQTEMGLSNGFILQGGWRF